MTLLDIYKKTPITIESAEHILLNSLGGRLVRRDLIDKTTNDTFGDTIDAAVADSLRVIRVLLNAESGDGKPPPVVRNATTADGEAYNILPGGIPTLAQPRAKFDETEDGEVTVQVRARNLQEARNLTRRKLADYGVSLDSLEENCRRGEERLGVPLQMPVNFEPDFWRSIAKMACNLLAANDRNLFLSSDFDSIRDYVLHGGDAWNFVCVNSTPLDILSEPLRLGLLDHLVIVRSNLTSGWITALVTLYGHLQFGVRLGCFAGSPVATAYRVDQIGRSHRLDDPADLQLVPTPFVPLRETDQSVWFDAMEVAMGKVLAVATDFMRRSAIQQIVRDSMDDALGPPGKRTFTADQQKKFSELVAERYVRLLKHMGFFEDGDHSTAANST